MKCWRSKSLSSRSRLRNFSTTDLHLSVTESFKWSPLCWFDLCNWSLTNLFACSSDDALSMRLMDLPVLYSSDTCPNIHTHTHTVRLCKHASVVLCVCVVKYVCVNLHSSLYKASWQARQRGDVGSIA